MLLTYVDDSGEKGLFLLSAVVIRDEAWLRTLDAWTDYRRWLRNNFNYRISKGDGPRTPVATAKPAFLRILLACIWFFEIMFGTFGKG